MAVIIRRKKKSTIEPINTPSFRKKKVAAASFDRYVRAVKAEAAVVVFPEAIQCLREAMANGDTHAALSLMDRLGMGAPKGPPIQVNQNNNQLNASVDGDRQQRHRSYESIIRELAENDPNPAATKLIEATAVEV